MSIESRSRQYGKVFDHWQIREFLGSGSGGKSAVFRLVHADSGSVQSALKVISLIDKRGDFESLSESRKTDYERVKQKCKDCAKQEVLLMNDLQGRTNVVDYLDHTFVDWADENGFGCDMLIRMELLKDLRSEIEADHVFRQEEVLKIGRDICTALVLCHSKNILHRDIKPENIFFNEDGNYKLGDFGVSRILSAAPMSKASTGVCTPEYAAPEQMSGKYDTRVDIYSLGLVLYELSNGNRLPFATSSYITEWEVQERMLGKPLPAPCNASKSFADVILKACAFDPNDRYQTAEDFLADLNLLAGGNPRPLENRPSVNRGTQKATPAVSGNATQYARPDTLRKSRSETGYAIADHTPAAGERRGAPDVSKPVIYALAAVAFIILLTFFVWPKHSHTWEEATCVQPRTCTECGKTEGEPLDHTPTERSCTSAALCTECGAVVQDAPGHQWTESDTGVKICSVCQAIDRESRNAQILSDAESYAETGQYREAIRILDEAWKETGEQAFFDLAGDYRMAFGISNTSYVAAGKYNSVLIKDDGSVVVVGDDEYSELEAKYWSDIVAVSAGDRHIVGLRSNGTVVSVGSNDVGQRDVDFWSDVVAIAAGDVHTIALLKDGTLRAAGHLWAPRCDVDGLYNRAGNKRIVSIAAGYLHTLALLEDGTVIASGENGYKQCDVENWTDIAAIYAGTYFSLGLRTDGSVVKAGITDWNISGWTNMVNLAAGDFFVAGVTSEGTLLSAGMDNAIGPNTPKTISTWKNIAQISAGNDHIIALTGNGKTRCAGKNDYKQINLDSFTVTYPRID